MYNRERSEKTQQMLDTLQEQATEMYCEIYEMKARFLRYLLGFYQGDTWIYVKKHGMVRIQQEEDGTLSFRNNDYDYVLFADDLDAAIEELAAGRVFNGKPSRDGYQNYVPLRRKAVKPLQFTVDILAAK